ncbi:MULTISPECIES: DUF2922 domain-containing protein [Bacillus]|uniref:DUF2922 domain-containing protein n=2 Tax=Bacillus TaxID=1386 RepID=A0A0M4FNN2_9BACI|nr:MULTISPECIES: DUF2922 domain-containing protein [Bacillus]ALC80234.1 hypothetical protein AM592_00435 [Bacillus gobiensis]MBP1082776.1 hypothetical protein [Bacillus capparidis]MED1098420.1 DUF2922 domain-containing protein [Bacillus capparidis]
MEKTVELQFLDELGKTVRISISEPKDQLTEAEIFTVMDSILTADVFFGSGGRLVAKKGARIVEKNTVDYEAS